MYYLPPIIAFLLVMGGAIRAFSIVDHADSVRTAIERLIVGGTAIAGGYYIMMKFLSKGA